MELDAIWLRLQQHTPTILGSRNLSKYAVMVPLMKKDDGVHVLFEVRSLQLRRQPGEICFPGGRIDPEDADEKAAAIRETKEELGIDTSDISEVYPLDYMVSPFGMMIYPFVGLIEQAERLNYNRSEVEEIFTVPLTYFLKHPPEIHHVEFKATPDIDFPFELLVGGKNYKWRSRGIDEYFYVYKGRAIWGLTARILAHFIELVSAG
ncbi:CoA pyrophosphatase [Neobacillus sp. YIM B02564]|uniref:CoA pyrophosphatase n=1 Tax=Neobacillus paridis TaxID=2803862 RepID=A0ABS1TRL1_9BACI|nr:CoA pyrophosphatase [Neobacillus paridis]MBL4953950.1 CoA pyrophosphatase [Neobacillus paridis]